MAYQADLEFYWTEKCLKTYFFTFLIVYVSSSLRAHSYEYGTTHIFM